MGRYNLCRPSDYISYVLIEMKDVIRYGFILSLICMTASASLAVVNSVTKPKIISQAQTEEQRSLEEVMPGGESFEPVKIGTDVIYYKIYDKYNKFIGVAFKAQGKGYSSLIESIVGMTEDGRITAIKILSQNETPGLGTRIAENNFLKQFMGRDTQGLGGIQAIAGATISSRAVIDSLEKKAQELKELIKNER